ncbi:MAG: alanine--tRNA ligase [Flavobacteriales bacterium]|nr:alanine--tRNA ligase [Flavobacteriales bacterium]
MTSQNIRQTFLDFFKEKGHAIVPSAPLVVKDDPTLMFTNAGMNQFKDIFLGNRPAKETRIADTQKCLRVSGKHNDLEEVGVDTYHHTMFEMLGNWSFGDYFKKEAIDWAWELLVDVYKLNPELLYATVFEGDDADGLPADTEAEDLWKQYLPTDRILRASKKDNFWEMGDQGPCGPCTEIHVDLRSDADRAKISGRELVNNDHPQVVEIWNLVFIQFNRKADGSLEPLPSKHVDTGMGFERLCMALQGKTSNYDTDVFSPLIAAISEMAKVPYKATDSKQDIAIRVISDHIRAVSFAIADGQLPANNGAGYVIRRILRRAIRYGYSFLNVHEPFMYRLVEVLATQMGPYFPEMKAQQKLVEKVIQEEELSFLRTLSKGIERFNAYLDGMSGKVVDGQFAFELYDTFGFPIDLTELMARERDLTVDSEGFQKGLAEQKTRSRAVATTENSDWTTVHEGNSEFIGYDHEESFTRILRYRKVKSKGREFYQVVLEQNPFYAEGGGQVGDVGSIYNTWHDNPDIDPVTTVFAEVFNTTKENNLTVLHCDKLPSDLKATIHADVDFVKRAEVKRNHSATHLLHAALRDHLGDHVEQKGSLVHPDHLRFDFSHFAKLTEEELAHIEWLVNMRIQSNIELEEFRAMPIEEAKAMGAMALFGEKYGDHVRVVVFDRSTSVELCGGTHVSATGEIGLFKIVSEASVAAGIRRIEAVTGMKALVHLNNAERKVTDLKNLLKSPEPIKAVEQLIAKNKELQQQLESLNSKAASGLKDELLGKAVQKDGHRLIAQRVSLTDANALKNLCFQLKETPDLIAVLGTVSNGKPTLHVAIGEQLLKERGLDAGKIVRELAKHIKGGGGGQAFYATAGGTEESGLDAAISAAASLV